MKLSFQNLTVENFKCIGALVEIDFAQFATGLHFVKGINKVEPALGANGAAKSTIFDALCWCLYGKTVAGHRGPDVRPWNSNKKTTVVLSLELDSSPYTVVRSIPSNLTVNGSASSQDQIEKDIMSYSVFVNTVVLGQNRPLFFDLRPQEKMELFDDVLGLERWERWSNAASVNVKELSGAELRLMTELGVCRSSINEFKSLLRAIKVDRDKWVEGKTTRVVEIKQQLETYREEVDECSSRKSEIEELYEQLKSEQELARERLEDEQKDLRNVERAYEKAKMILSRAKKDIVRLKQESANLKSVSVCPTCGQSVRREDLAEHRGELSKRISELRLQIENLNTGQLRLDMETTSDLVKGTKKILIDLDNRIAKIFSELKAVSAEYAVVTTRLKETGNLLKTWSQEINPYTSQLEAIRIKLKEQRVRIVELEDELSRVRGKLDRVKFWVSGFKACRLYLLEEVLSELQLISNAVLPELGLDDWEIIYEIEKENKSGTIKRGLNVGLVSPTSINPVKFDNFSGGEQQRLRLVGSLSLSEVLLSYAGIESDLEVLDEPSKHLSIQGIRDLCETLPVRSQRLGRRTFYTDHQVIESSYFTSTLTVLREKKSVTVAVDG